MQPLFPCRLSKLGFLTMCANFLQFDQTKKQSYKINLWSFTIMLNISIWAQVIKKYIYMKLTLETKAHLQHNK